MSKFDLVRVDNFIFNKTETKSVEITESTEEPGKCNFSVNFGLRPSAEGPFKDFIVSAKNLIDCNKLTKFKEMYFSKSLENSPIGKNIVDVDYVNIRDLDKESILYSHIYRNRRTVNESICRMDIQSNDLRSSPTKIGGDCANLRKVHIDNFQNAPFVGAKNLSSWGFSRADPENLIINTKELLSVELNFIDTDESNFLPERLCELSLTFKRGIQEEIFNGKFRNMGFLMEKIKKA
jgi:hypothetical protein